MRSAVLAFTALLVLVIAATTAAARNPWEGRPPYGLSMMTQQERQTYWKELQALPTAEEQEAYWLAHIEKMKQRALERGVELPPPPRRLIPDDQQKARPAAPYFEEIMTDEEIEAYYDGLEALTVPSERKAFIADHIKRMQERGLERGISLPSTADFAYALKGQDGTGSVAPEGGDAGQGAGRADLKGDSEGADGQGG
jgi:hypothetical protein